MIKKISSKGNTNLRLKSREGLVIRRDAQTSLFRLINIAD